MRRIRSRGLIASLAAVLVTIALLVVPRAVADPPPGAPVFGDAAGIHVVSATQVDSRLWALSVSTPALGRAVRVRVLLPAGYDATSTRFPVLYLFHGTSGGPDDWLTQGDAEATTASAPMIVVLPDAGFDDNGGSWFTNWFDTKTSLGPSQWETFHITQLIPWVDTNLRTIATRTGRAIAGLSQGGFGSMSYAARHPELFAAAAAFSGAPDIARDAITIPPSSLIISATATFLDGVEPDAMFGSRLLNEINWDGHDPATLLTNLRGMNLSMWTATGIPGQYDPFPPQLTELSAGAIEAATHVSTQLFHQELTNAGIPSYYKDYVFGTHIFPYWADDLRDFIPKLVDVFAHPTTPSAPVDYMSVDKTWSQWGWTVANSRVAPQAFSHLSAATATGFRLNGVGSATVTTPALYAPGTTKTVLIHSPTSVTTVTRTADAGGHLTIAVPLTGALQLLAGTTQVTIS